MDCNIQYTNKLKEETVATKSKPKTITMSVVNRLTLLGILPKEEDIIRMRTIRNLKMDLALDDDEIRDLNIVQEDGLIKWDRTKEKPKEIPMDSVRRGVIKETLEKLNKEKKVTDQIIDLWDIFC